MKSHFFSFIIACSLIVSAGAAEWYPGRILVKPKDGTTLAQTETFHKTCGTKIKNILMAGDYPWQVIEFSPLESVPNKVQQYIKSGLFEDVCPDYLVEAAIIPNDPYTQDSNDSYHVPLIGATAAWNIVNKAPNVVIGLVDSGILYTHEDLKGSLWINSNEIPDNGIDDDKNGYIDDVYGVDVSGVISGDPLDTVGHGTHIAGILGATGNNDKGVAGITWNTQIMACKFMTKTTGSISGAVEGMVYARKNGATILNLSWTISENIKILQDELKTLQSRGMLVVCAAGNHSSDLSKKPQYPACYSTTYQNIICVGNSTSTDTKANNSDYSSTYVHLFAPGTGIYSTYVGSNSKYTSLNGTSMATPMVTAAIALYMQIHPSENWKDIKNKLLNSVEKKDSLANYCSTGGRLDVGKFITGKTTPAITWNEPTPIAYGTPLSSTQLKATSKINGSFTYTPAAGTVLDVGKHIITANFTPSDTSSYSPNEFGVTMQINKAHATLTWNDLSPITYGTPLSSEQLNATANVSGTFVYSPEAGTILPIGTNSLALKFIPTDATRYFSENLTNSIVVIEPPVPSSPTLVIDSKSKTSITFSWQQEPSGGYYVYQLQQASFAEGPWTAIESATSPYTITIGPDNSFFRLVIIPKGSE
ncbi:MAG: S8 family serine peptidase [Verrucomicrobia bacterium]|nr:S8 family serine peptidase [Verrucomicrobiota bacterium]